MVDLFQFPSKSHLIGKTIFLFKPVITHGMLGERFFLIEVVPPLKQQQCFLQKKKETLILLNVRDQNVLICKNLELNL